MEESRPHIRSSCSSARSTKSAASSTSTSRAAGTSSTSRSTCESPRSTPTCFASWRSSRTGTRTRTGRSPRRSAASCRPCVGTVMNRNPIPIVLPCHRVVGANGSLTGYGGGLDLKRHFLRLEGATSSMPRVVVVGGGFGGLLAVRGLRSADVEVTLVDRRTSIFQPLAYQVSNRIAFFRRGCQVPLRQIQGVSETRASCWVRSTGSTWKRDAFRWRASNGGRLELEYDTLVVAGGARSRTSATTTGLPTHPS